MEYAIGEGVMTPAEYRDFLIKRMAEAAAAAWRGRKPAMFSAGMGFAVVGHNRRAMYADGSAQMYGKTSRSDFRGFEGYEDHTVGVLATRDAAGRLTGVVVNV